jgi:DNA-binding MarR family transcriptional regulator
VAYLHQRRYVDVSTDADDRRGKLITLTDRGVLVFQILAETQAPASNLIALV